MTYQDALNLMIRDSALNVIEKDAIFCYGMCKMTVINEFEDSQTKYKRLQFVEFLEMLGRIAELKYRGTDLERVPLAKKLETVLEEALAIVGYERKEVNIVVNDVSESDDEY